MDKSITRRLAFTKYVYRIAVEQSEKPEPMSATSVLSFHDAIELFMQLASEYLDTGQAQITFMQYWDILSKKSPKGELTQKESIRRLNKARISLKHNGTLPSKLDIEAFRSSATNFFEENTPIVFGIRFSDVNLSELIRNDDARNSIIKAQEMLAEGKLEDVLDNAALAFNRLIDEYERRKRGQFGHSPFFFGEDMTFMSSFMLGRSVVGELGRFVDVVKESIESLQIAVKILSLGIDYRRYTRFRLLTPSISQTMDEKYHIHRTQTSSQRILTSNDVQFCIDFVIESAITLQEFDFDVEHV